MHARGLRRASVHLQEQDQRNMRSALLLTCLLLLASRPRAQNLVPNWSFEEISSCPEYTGDLEKAMGWLVFRETPDLFNVCGQPDTTGVPANALGWQFPAHGNGYAGFHAFSGDDGWPWYAREYLGVALPQPLVIGQTYHASLKVSLAIGGSEKIQATFRCAVDKIGLLCTMDYGLQEPLHPLPERAHISSTAIISDSVGWAVIAGSFVADSAYRYVVVGNFFTDEQTNWVVVNPDGTDDLAYYFVDEVCVSPDPLFCSLLSGLAEAEASPFRAWQGADGALQLAGLRAAGVQKVSVIDATGRAIEQQLVSGMDGLRFSTTGLAQGVYVVVAERSNGSRIAERVFLGR